METFKNLITGIKTKPDISGKSYRTCLGKNYPY